MPLYSVGLVRDVGHRPPLLNPVADPAGILALVGANAAARGEVVQ